MSDDIRFIAEFITEDIHVFNECILIEDDTRRDFLAKVMSTATFGAMNPEKLLKNLVTGQVTGQVAGKIKNAIEMMDNEELAETPEDLWVPFISNAKLAKFIQENPEHFDGEVQNKYYELVTYLYNPDKTIKGIAKRTLDIMSSRAKANPSVIINQALRDKDSILFQGLRYNEDVKGQDLIKAAKEAGFQLDPDIVKQAMKSIEKVRQEDERKMAEYESNRKAKKDALDREEWEATVHGEYDPSDKAAIQRYKPRAFDESRKRNTTPNKQQR